MMISGTPLAVELPSDPSFKERFWYWRGASGRKYIHSVYALEDCPPLPGAVYVAVRRQGGMRVVMSVGRFTPFWDGVITGRCLDELQSSGVNEIHVHLLAKSTDVGLAIEADLRAACDADRQDFLSEGAVGLLAA